MPEPCTHIVTITKHDEQIKSDKETFASYRDQTDRQISEVFSRLNDCISIKIAMWLSGTIGALVAVISVLVGIVCYLLAH